GGTLFRRARSAAETHRPGEAWHRTSAPTGALCDRSDYRKQAGKQDLFQSMSNSQGKRMFEHCARDYQMVRLAFSLLTALCFGALITPAQQPPVAPTPGGSETQAPATPPQPPSAAQGESEAPQTLHLLVGRSI